MASEYSGPEPVAVIGSSCRLPGGASSPSKLWSLLQKPRDVLSDIPPSRFNAKAFYHEDPEHHGVSLQYPQRPFTIVEKFIGEASQTERRREESNEKKPVSERLS